MTQKRRTTKTKRRAEIRDYDTRDTSTMIDRDKPLTFEDLGLELPKPPPTQVGVDTPPLGPAQPVESVCLRA